MVVQGHSDRKVLYSQEVDCVKSVFTTVCGQSIHQHRGTFRLTSMTYSDQYKEARNHFVRGLGDLTNRKHIEINED